MAVLLAAGGVLEGRLTLEGARTGASSGRQGQEPRQGPDE